jgi:glycosyltransferase involved in cell wall biosynthesis
MRFLLINQFYPPDHAPTGKYLHDLARVLVRRGHQVKVICSRRSYDGGKKYPRHETMEGVDVARLCATGFGRRSFIGKIADYASFYVSLFLALMLERNRPDLILSLTTPPYVGLLGKLAAIRFASCHAHWVMDLYPDVMLANGSLRSGLFIRILKKLAVCQFKGASQVFALGPTMMKSVSAYINTKKLALHAVPLWSSLEPSSYSGEDSNPLRSERGWTKGKVVLLYSGNMGLGHRFGEFLQAAKTLGASGPLWVFAGGGKRKVEIEEFAKSNSGSPIVLLDYVSPEKLWAHLTSADVHLASLDSGWQGCMVPSKLQASFAVARPVIYVGGNHCETARWIDQSGGGWVVAENDLEGLLTAIRKSLDPIERQVRGQAALDFARQHFEKSSNCLRMAMILEAVK